MALSRGTVFKTATKLHTKGLCPELSQSVRGPPRLSSGNGSIIAGHCGRIGKTRAKGYIRSTAYNVPCRGSWSWSFQFSRDLMQGSEYTDSLICSTTWTCYQPAAAHRPSSPHNPALAPNPATFSTSPSPQSPAQGSRRSKLHHPA